MKGFSGHLASFLDENSTFGRITGSLWLIIAVNILFVLCSLPVITAGPAFAAMYHVILKAMRNPDDDIRPVYEFFRALKANFRQAIVLWICFLIIAAVVVLDIDIITAYGGWLVWMRWPVYLIAGIVLLVFGFIYPVMAAFESTIPQLIRNAFYFAARNPLRAVLSAAVYIGPLILTYMDLQRLPLYAFIWSTCGFAAAASFVSRMLINDFSRFLPKISSPAEEEY